MVHVDVKKLGRIPPGGGHRVHGRTSAQYRATRRAKTSGARAGFVFLHSALDDHSRLTYTEELPDELGSTAAGFWAPGGEVLPSPRDPADPPGAERQRRLLPIQSLRDSAGRESQPPRAHPVLPSPDQR
jgi:hypothetical protein